MTSRNPVFKQKTCGISSCKYKSIRRVTFDISKEIFNSLSEHVPVGSGSQFIINCYKSNIYLAGLCYKHKGGKFDIAPSNVNLINNDKDVLLDQQSPAEALLDYQNPADALQEHQDLSNALQDLQDPQDAMQDCKVSSDALLRDQNPSDGLLHQDQADALLHLQGHANILIDHQNLVDALPDHLIEHQTKAQSPLRPGRIMAPCKATPDITPCKTTPHNTPFKATPDRCGLVLKKRQAKLDMNR